MNVKTLIEQVDLVDYAEKFTDLTKQGDSYRGVCPVCKHDNNSEFQIYDHKTYHCWACGSSGDVINLIKDMNSVDFYTAVETLADELNVDIEQDKGYKERKEKVSKRQQYALENHKNVKAVKDYLMKERGLSEDTIEYFKLGADQRGNVTIPFVDVNGRYVGSAIRRFEGTPKYLTNRNDDVFVKAEFLYNMRGAKEKLTNRLYLVEGFFCAMSLWQNNFAGVAYNSSQPSKQHLQQIGNLRKLYPELTVTLVPDNDGVAYPLVEKVRKNILRYVPDLPVEILLLPEGIKDVNDYFVAGHTAEEWESLPVEPIDLFVLKMELNKCSSILAERAVVEAFVKTISNNLMLLQIGEYLSERWKQDKKAVNGFLDVSQEGECLTEDFKDPDQCTRETLEMLKTPCVSYGVPTLDEGIRGAGRRKDVTFIGGYSSSGKAVTLDTPIATPDGFVPMGEIKIGDTVYDENGKECKVVGVYPQGKKEVVRITFVDGTHVDCCKEHLWKYKTVGRLFKKRGWQVASTQELMEKPIMYHGWRNLMIPVCKPIPYSEKELPLDPWLLGALLGDGGFTTISISFTNAEADVVEKVKEKVKPYGLRVEKGSTDYQYRIVGDRGCKSNPLKAIIKEMGLVGHLGYEKFIPEIYKHASVEQRKELLRGLIDTDGTIEAYGHIHFNSGSRQLIEDFMEIVRSLGHRCNRLSIQKREGKNPEYATGIQAVTNDLFTSEKHTKRYQNRKPQGRNYHTEVMRIDKIEELGEAKEMQCITVDSPEHTFICGDYIVTHNTLLTICMAVDMVVRQRKKVIYFSMEMSAGALYERVLAYILQRPSDIVDEMLLAGDELVYNCLEKLKEHLYVIDKNGLTIEQVDAYIKDAKAKLFDGELDCVFIDYIQYMKGCAEFSMLAETAKGMKPLAKENNIHVVVLSQLNRGSRIWEKPTMADMKGGGDLEASADNILLIWRPDKDPSLLPEEAALKRGTVMVAVGKARNGAKVEEVEMYIDGATSRIRPR